MNTMRAKMKVQEVIRRDGHEQLKMLPVVKSGGYPADGTDEDNTFAKFSPSGCLDLTITNPALIGRFNPGDTYYVAFEKVEG